MVGQYCAVKNRGAMGANNCTNQPFLAGSRGAVDSRSDSLRACLDDGENFQSLTPVLGINGARGSRCVAKNRESRSDNVKPLKEPHNITTTQGGGSTRKYYPLPVVVTWPTRW